MIGIEMLHQHICNATDRWQAGNQPAKRLKTARRSADRHHQLARAAGQVFGWCNASR
jgi:hypothetical protein